MKRMFWMMLVGLLLGVSGCNSGEWTVGAAGDYETAMGTAVYSPDPNGGAGLMVLGGPYLPGDGADNLALGPYVRFNLGDVANVAVGRVAPGDWWNGFFTGKPAQLYGTMGVLWETQGGGVIWAPGTELVIMPKWAIHPTVTTIYFEPGDDADADRGVKVLLGAEYRFGGKN